MRRVQPCSVCGVEVEAEALRATVPADFEYRYAAMLTWYFVSGTNDRHRCQLTPRRFAMAVEPELERTEAPVREEEVQDAPTLGWVSV